MTLLYSILTSVALVIGVSGSIPYESIEKAFVSNDETALTAHCGEKVLMTVLGDEGVYSRSQAKLVLKNFFSKWPSGTFKFYFKGKESSDGSFCIGKYTVGANEFRVTINFKNANQKYVIESLDIDRD